MGRHFFWDGSGYIMDVADCRCRLVAAVEYAAQHSTATWLSSDRHDRDYGGTVQPSLDVIWHFIG